MRRLISLLLVIRVHSAAAEDVVVVHPLPNQAEEAATIPWITEGATAWRTGAAIFHVADPESAPTVEADGWLAASLVGLHVYVVVRDDQHRNTKTEGSIWDGDALQIGVDTMPAWDGDLPAGMPAPVPHRTSITVALLPDGPSAWAHHHDVKEHIGSATNRLGLHIVRDEATASTTYDILMPWSEFAQPAGAIRAVGVAVQVNDTDSTGDQCRLYWGNGAGGRLRADQFERLTIADMTANVIGIAMTKPEIWRVDQAAHVRIGVANPAATTIRVSFAGQDSDYSLTSSPKWHGFLVTLKPLELGEESLPVRVQVLASDGSTLAERTGTVRDGMAPVRRAAAALSEAAAVAQHPLHERHLRSLRAILLSDTARVEFLLADDPDQAQLVAAAASRILSALEDEQWSRYVSGERQLVFVSRSKGDGSLQPYRLTLPRGWDPEKTYPAIVYLHGSGRRYYPLDYAVDCFIDQRGPGDDEEDPALVILPYARGNYGYRGLGEADVWEALADVEKTFHIDPDRRYLRGFSMGGGGVWALGLHSPDTWAAITVFSGVRWFLPVGHGLGANACGLPVAIYHGEEDRTVPIDDARAMLHELRMYGVEPIVDFVADTGHEIRPESDRRLRAWMFAQRRERPMDFTFVADGPTYLGRNGIRMTRDPARALFPRFHCRIDGQRVLIDSEGTAALTVDLGAEGLGMIGEVTVEWNGREVHRGPVQVLHLSEAEFTPRRR